MKIEAKRGRGRLLEKKDSLEWITRALMGAVVTDGDSQVVFGVQEINGEIVAMALETTTGAKSLEAVLETHAHEVIGRYGSFERAKVACARYARKWRRRRQEAKRCECKPIATKRARR